jgi:hypothetical protein
VTEPGHQRIDRSYYLIFPDGSPMFCPMRHKTPVDDDLAACIDGIEGIAPDVGINRGDLAGDDRHVADGIKPDGWIDHASPLMRRS